MRLSHDIRPNVAKPLSHWDATACDSLQLIFASKSQSGLETVAVIRNFLACVLGRSGGAMVLGKLPMLGRPTNLD